MQPGHCLAFGTVKTEVGGVSSGLCYLFDGSLPRGISAIENWRGRGGTNVGICTFPDIYLSVELSVETGLSVSGTTTTQSTTTTRLCVAYERAILTARESVYLSHVLA